MAKWIIMVMSEPIEVFKGTEIDAERRAYELWLEAADQDYEAVAYSKEAAKECGLEEEDDGE